MSTRDMNTREVPSFVVIDSVYGPFIVNRYCHFQAEALIKTGYTHIEAELRNIFVVIDQLPDEAVIIDGGTNIGFFTIPVARRVQGRGIKIIGFEPQRPLFHAIAGSIALNGFDNCFVYNQGLGEKPGQAAVPAVNYAANADFGLVSIREKEAAKEAAPGRDYLDDKTIEVVAIDDLHLPRVDFIKLDIEGHEPAALRGAKNTIRQFRPFLWVEYFLSGAEVIKNSLSDIEGYVFLIIDNQNMLCAPEEKSGAIGVLTNQP